MYRNKRVGVNMKSDLSGYIIQENTSVIDAAEAIDATKRQIIFICDGTKLLASCSDGDLRRYILRSGDLSKSVKKVANYEPISVKVGESAKALQMIAENPYIRAVPVLNENDEIVSIIFSEKTSVHRVTRLEVPVVIMAGGKGTRLAPFTDVLPKPLIPIGEMTITEHIMERFLDFGCNEFIMIINHKRELIKAYFSETPYIGSLRFIDEKEFLGTAGGLKLLTGIINETFFMTNCDTIIEADYEDLFNHHKKTGAIITMICALKKVSVPYGTVELDENGDPICLIEKPEYPLLTNTGLYVIEPSFLDEIPQNEHIHITEVIQRIIDKDLPVGVYPVGEAGWLDMGQLEGLSQMERSLS